MRPAFHSDLMPHSETIQKFALQGPLSVVQLVLLGLAVAGIMAYLAWRWARDSGSWKKSAFLLLLRLGALAVALWMLAGASTVTVRRDTRAKSVVFMVDSSASMGLVDPVDGSGQTVRWAGSDAKLRASPPVAALDEVIGTLQSARSDVARLRQLTEGGDPDQHGQILWDQIHRSVACRRRRPWPARLPRHQRGRRSGRGTGPGRRLSQGQRRPDGFLEKCRRQIARGPPGRSRRLHHRRHATHRAPVAEAGRRLRKGLRRPGQARPGPAIQTVTQ